MVKVGGKRLGAGRKLGSPNKSTAAIRALACKHSEAAIQTLLQIMQSNDTPSAARVSAAKELIERGYGKAGNHVDLELKTPLSKTTPANAIEVITDKVSEGVISTSDGQRLIGLIVARIKAVEVDDLNERVKLLETKSQ